MKKILLALFLSGSVIFLDAQYVREDTDTIPEQRDWLGFNFTTGLHYITFAVPVSPHTALWYKHQLTVSKNLRISLHAYGYDMQEDFSEDGGTFVIGDSATSYSSDYDRWSFYLHGGYEWFKPSKRVTPIYGVDLIAGYEVESDTRFERYSIRDTSICATCFMPDPDRPEQTMEQKTGFVELGFGIDFGFLFRVKKHGAFYIHFATEMLYSFPANEYRRDTSGYYLPPEDGLKPVIHPVEFHYFYNF